MVSGIIFEIKVKELSIVIDLMGDEKNLSSRLRSETKEVHTQVSGAKVVAKMINKTITLDEYLQVLARYYHMYAVLENEVEKHCENSIIKSAFFKELNRLQAIEADLAYYIGADWINSKVVLEAKEPTKDFTSHILKLSNETPELLVSHMYVRYLGDLAGGQILGNKMRGCFEEETLPDKQGDKDAGIKFYLFSDISDIKQFVLKFKKGLDSIVHSDPSKTEELHEKLIDEAVVCFELNGDILSELD